MATLTGIAGMQMGDAAGGKIALDIQKRILKILFDSDFTYKTATIADARQVNAGSVTYYVPEILQAKDYGADGSGDWQQLNAGTVTVPINITRKVKYEYESFDYSRLGDVAGVVGMIANSVAMTIENDLNSHFWLNLSPKFNQGSGELRTQSFSIPNLVKDSITTDEARTCLYQLQRIFTKISKTFNKKAMGVPKSDLMLFLDPYADINLRQAFWNQPNKLGERVVGKDMVGTQIGNGMYYYVDKMLGENIAANTSFSNDKTIDLSAYIGFIIHNEAVAMPFNLQQVGMLQNPENLNPRFIAKYQFGFGIVRPWLVYAITKTDHTRGR